MAKNGYERIEFRGKGTDGKAYVVLLDRPYVPSPTPLDPDARTLGLGVPKTSSGQPCRMIGGTIFEVIGTGVRIKAEL